MRPSQHFITYAALAVSIASLAVAAAAVIFALSVRGNTGRFTVEPQALTADNPASRIPHYESVVAVPGAVDGVSSSEIVVSRSHGETTSIPLTDRTTFYRRGAQKDPAVFQKEMEEFRAVIDTHAVGSSETFLAPEPFEAEEIALSDIAVGSAVLVLMGNNEAMTVYLLPPAPPSGT